MSDGCSAVVISDMVKVTLGPASEVDVLKARVAELERELAAEREVSAARLAALEWLRDQGVAVQGDSEPVYWPDIDDDQPALEFWENLSAAVGREVGPREGEQGC